MLVLKLPGYPLGPCSMGKLTIFSKRVFFCQGFATINHSFSIFLVFALYLVVARSELISEDYSDGCGSKPTIKFDAYSVGSGGLQTRAYARGGFWGFKPPPPIGLSTKMHSKENITFLALLSLFFCNDTDSNMI